MSPKISMKERFMNALLKKEVDRVPVLSVTQTGTIGLMKTSGAYWPEAHKEAEPMARLAIAAFEVAGLEAVRVPFGMYAEAEALGCKVEYHEGRNDFTPTVTDPVKDINSLRIPEPTEGKMGMILDSVTIVKDKVADSVPIIAGVVGPFTLAGYVYGVDLLMKHIIMNPSAVHRVLEVTWQVSANFAKALSDMGATISLLEPITSTIGPKFFDSFAAPYIKKIVDKIGKPAVIHVCGNSVSILQLMVATGMKGLSIDQKVNIVKAKEIIAGKAALIGNVDPVSILQDGKPADVARESKRTVDEGIDILAPGCGISPFTSTENIKAMVQIVKSV